MIYRGLVVFFAVMLADVCWARYSSAAGQGRRWAASTWAVGIYLLGSLSVIQYTADHWMIVPAVFGAFLGTAMGVKKP